MAEHRAGKRSPYPPVSLARHGRVVLLQWQLTLEDNEAIAFLTFTAILLVYA